MIHKRLFGDILVDLGIIDRSQLESALEKQREILARRMPAHLGRADLISEARVAAGIQGQPRLGQILFDQGLLSDVQIEQTLSVQADSDPIVTLDNTKLAKAVQTVLLVSSSLNLTEVLTNIMAQVNDVTQSEASTLMLLDQTTGELVFSVPTGPKAEALIDVRLPSGKGIAGWVVAHSKPLLVADVSRDPRFYNDIDHHSGYSTRSALCVPLLAHGRMIGVLEVINKKEGVFNEEDSRLLGILAPQAALAIENARLYEELRSSRDDLEKRVSNRTRELESTNQKLIDEIEQQEQIEQALLHSKQRYRDLEDQLIRSERLAVTGQLAASVAHEINSPLQGITSLLNVIRKDHAGDKKLLANLDLLKGAFERIRDTVRKLLDLNRPGKERRQKTDINQIVTDALSLVETLLKRKHIRVVQDLQPDLPVIIASPQQLAQVFMNLINNAMEAMAEEPDGSRVLALKTCLQGDAIVIEVADSGPGFSVEDEKQMFNPFYTRKKSLGMGVGLNICQEIMRSHGGTITAVNRADRGALLTLCLPIKES